MGTTPGYPVLETGCLRLRPFTPADADAVRALAGAREVGETTLNLPHPYPPGAATAWIKTHGQLAMAGEAHCEGAPFYNGVMRHRISTRHWRPGSGSVLRQCWRVAPLSASERGPGVRFSPHPRR